MLKTLEKYLGGKWHTMPCPGSRSCDVPDDYQRELIDFDGKKVGGLAEGPNANWLIGAYRTPEGDLVAEIQMMRSNYDPPSYFWAIQGKSS